MTMFITNPTVFKKSILKILTRHPAGIKEYDLIHLLQKAGELPADEAGDNHRLFQIHFVLFHALYQLRTEIWDEQSGHLTIDPLQIQLTPYQPTAFGLAEYDPLAEYYLNIDHLTNTTAPDVDAMLDQFWVKFLAYEDYDRALQVLGLEKPVTYTEIRRRYRDLAKRHHPDSGGNQSVFQEINRAMVSLDVYYSR